MDKLEQAEITMKLEETENLKLQHVNKIQTNASQINNINDSDTELSKKNHQNYKHLRKNPNFKGKPFFKKWCNYCRRYANSIAEGRQKQQDNQNEPQKCREPNKSLHQFTKKDQNLPNKNIHSNNSSGTPLPNNSNYSRQQSPYNTKYRGQPPTKEIYRISHKVDIVDQIVEIVNIQITIQDQIQINTALTTDLI